MPRECRGTSVNLPYIIFVRLAQAASESTLRHRPAGYSTVLCCEPLQPYLPPPKFNGGAGLLNPPGHLIWQLCLRVKRVVSTCHMSPSMIVIACPGVCITSFDSERRLIRFEYLILCVQRTYYTPIWTHSTTQVERPRTSTGPYCVESCKPFDLLLSMAVKPVIS